MYHMIKMPTDFSQPCLWLTFDDDFSNNRPERKLISIDELSTLPNDAYVAVVLPGQILRTVQVPMPQAKLSELKRALPYAVEDQLADDVENLYIAHGAYKDGVQMAAVVNKTYFETVYQLLKKQCMVVTCVTADFLFLHWMPNTWSLAFIDGQIFWRYGEAMGATMDADMFPNFWAMILEQYQDDMPKAITVYSDDKKDEVFFEHCSVPIEWKATEASFDCKGIFKVPTFNFLQDRYRLKARMSAIKKRWVQAAAALVCTLVLVFIGNLGGWIYLNHETKVIAQQEQAIGTHLGLSVSLTHQRSEIGHMLQGLEHMQKDDAYLHLLGLSAEIFHNHQEWQISSMSYQDDILSLVLLGHAGTHIAPLVNNLHQLSAEKITTKKLASSAKQVSYQITLEHKS